MGKTVHYFIFAFGLGLTLCSSGFARYVSYSLSAKEAERVLASLPERSPTDDAKWLSLLGSGKKDPYTIRRGDNLWKIAKRLAGNSYYWSKLWELNPELTNPHNLEKGQPLRLIPNHKLRNIASYAENDIRVPLIKLLPEKRGAVADIDQDAIINLDLKNRFAPRFFVMSPEDPVYGSVTGSYTDSEFLDVHRAIYIRPNSENIEVGKRYAVVHSEKPLRDDTQDDSPMVGQLVQAVALIEVVEVGEKLIKTRALEFWGTPRRGDSLVDAQPVVNFALKLNPPDDLQCQIIMGEDPDYHIFGQGQLVVLNKGTDAGMKEGYLFRVWKDTDPFLGSEREVEPESKGEVQIVHVGKLSSIGFVARNIEPLRAGDTLIPRQAFPNPNVFKFKPRESREIN